MPPSPESSGGSSLSLKMSLNAGNLIKGSSFKSSRSRVRASRSLSCARAFNCLTSSSSIPQCASSTAPRAARPAWSPAYDGARCPDPRPSVSQFRFMQRPVRQVWRELDHEEQPPGAVHERLLPEIFRWLCGDALARAGRYWLGPCSPWGARHHFVARIGPAVIVRVGGLAGLGYWYPVVGMCWHAVGRTLVSERSGNAGDCLTLAR
jgi:hypothetical protein